MLVVARHMEPGEVESLRQLFQQLDEEATGTISLVQLQEAMRHMGKEVGEAELRALLEALDIRHHGVIEYDEFLAGGQEGFWGCWAGAGSGWGCGRAPWLILSLPDPEPCACARLRQHPCLASPFALSPSPLPPRKHSTLLPPSLPPAACLEEQHLTETKLRAAFEFFDHGRTGAITETDVVQVGGWGWESVVRLGGGGDVCVP